jgi:hypothetical protein
VIIVMTANLGNLVTTSVQRVVAVVIGSTLAVVVQLLFEAAFRRVRDGAPPPKPAAKPHSHEE